MPSRERSIICSWGEVLSQFRVSRAGSFPNFDQVGAETFRQPAHYYQLPAMIGTLLCFGDGH